MSACGACLRRSRLLVELGGVLDCRAGDRRRLLELLAGDSDELVEALGGRRKAALRAVLARPQQEPDGAGAPAVCRHRQGFPVALAGPEAAHLLYLAGRPGCLDEAAAAPTVALIGSRRPSEYGIEMAHSVARALAASGSCVVSLLADGIARAARDGASREGRAGMLVLADGLPASGTSHGSQMTAHTARTGCAVSELPPGRPGRRWGAIAAERTVAELADLVIVVEVEHTPAQLFVAEHARASGRVLAAVPGRSTSHLAQGPLALLREGAKLVRGPDDALELLDLDPGHRERSNGSSPAGLPPPLRRVLERVAGGHDTPEQLLGGSDCGSVLAALSQLELMGRLRRGRGGRYVVCV